MKTEYWSTGNVVKELRDRIWLYLSQSSDVSTVLLDASALLQVSTDDLIALSRVYFVTSNEVGHLLKGMPDLLRRLPTTTELEEEWSTERIRGSIKWPVTLAARASGAPPNLYVTQPTTRAYQTPENELLTFVLRAVRTVGERSGWSTSESRETGWIVAQRTQEASKWLQSRMLQSVEERTPTDRSLARIRSGRHSRRFQAVLDTFDVYVSLVGHLDASALRSVVEKRGLVTQESSVLFEILSLFRILDALDGCGWSSTPLGRVSSGLVSMATRSSQILDVYYQHAPNDLKAGSLYGAILKDHDVPRSGLKPDVILRFQDGDDVRWLLVECKMRGSVEDAARAALFDLLAYQETFSIGLAGSSPPVGLGIAWGSDLLPAAEGPHMLCTPDTIAQAIQLFTG